MCLHGLRGRNVTFNLHRASFLNVAYSVNYDEANNSRNTNQCTILCILLNNQRDASLAVLFISHCKITLHVSGALCTHHQEYIKTVDAITGTTHVSVRCRLNPL